MIGEEHSYNGDLSLLPSVIKAIIFDFGNVICSFDNMRFCQRISESSPFSAEEIHRKVYVEGTLTQRYEEGRITSSFFYERVKELCLLDLDIDRFREAYTNIFIPIPENIELIRKLKGRYKLGLLSNTNEWHHEHAIELVVVYPLFDAVAFSYIVGVKKPDDRIYLDCLGKLGLRPEECIYIDDIEEYAKKASDLGMIGHTYIDHNKLISFLYEQGIIKIE
ncbi:MAG: HAD family phosphatase [Candidatus Thermoplasmatota archaeon]|nr:HAD family phosphatase [Candidatus Thermoplasmatota archaeon]